jgi:hypothetical protein
VPRNAATSVLDGSQRLVDEVATLDAVADASPAARPRQRAVLATLPSSAEGGPDFRRSVVTLLTDREGGPVRDAAAHEAAEALLALAMLDDDVALWPILRADPLADEVSWSVSCYQIGDLTPSDVHECDGPSEAVVRLAGCEDLSHVAAELVCASGGLRWVAMTRLNRRLAFQLPDTKTVHLVSGEAAPLLQPALRRWRQQLAPLVRGDEQGPRPRTPRGIDTGAPGETGLAGPSAAEPLVAEPMAMEPMTMGRLAVAASTGAALVRPAPSGRDGSGDTYSVVKLVLDAVADARAQGLNDARVVAAEATAAAPDISEDIEQLAEAGADTHVRLERLEAKLDGETHRRLAGLEEQLGGLTAGVATGVAHALAMEEGLARLTERIGEFAGEVSGYVARLDKEVEPPDLAAPDALDALRLSVSRCAQSVELMEARFGALATRVEELLRAGESRHDAYAAAAERSNRELAAEVASRLQAVGEQLDAAVPPRRRSRAKRAES